MKSIRRRFIRISNTNHYWSTYICLTEAIRGQKFSKKTIHYWFYKLVDKNDYQRSDKKHILSHLRMLSNRVDEGKNLR